MAGVDNLIPTTQRSEAEAKELGRRGGIASGEARRRKKSLREALQLAMSQEVTNKKGETATLGEVAMIKLASQMAEGNIKAIKLGANILGELKKDTSTEIKCDGTTIIVKSERERERIEKMNELE